MNARRCFFRDSSRQRRDVCKKGQRKMLDRFISKANRAAAPVDENAVTNASSPAIPADFSRLSGDEIERLIALCEAPALLWRPDTAPSREPEPFGMIA
jgi:hypothetical protein